MSSNIDDPRKTGLWRDAYALRRYWWFVAGSLMVAVAAALLLGVVASTPDEARFRESVLIDALPPLFGPPVTPGPFDYARLATSDDVLQAVATNQRLSIDELRPRLTASASFNRPDIDLKVTGANALAISRTWRDAFEQAVRAQSGDLERELTATYNRQLDEANKQLDRETSSARQSPNDAAAQQRQKAAQENYETASRLSQSYDVVASTLKAQPIAVVGPHIQSAGIGSMRGRLAAAVAIGLLVGVGGALLLAFVAGRVASPSGAVVDTDADAPAEIARARSTRI